ncbi:tRNA-splicing endonuclease subunit [Parahypoxylon ruwenzoriense]
MASSAGAGAGGGDRGVRPLVRISKVAGRYLLFDIDDVMHLRRHHNICSVFVGTIPQNPQQNIFMGLPIELMPEEAQVLVDKRVAFVVDDAAFHHPARLAATLDDDARRRYLQVVKAEGRRAQMAAAESQMRSRPQKAVNKKAKRDKDPEEDVSNKEPAPEKSSKESDQDDQDDDNDNSTSLFDIPPSSPKPPKPATQETPPFAITPTTSNLLLLSSPPSSSPPVPVDVPPSYPLYAHLQDRGYYMMPGLRFGCDYNVYPGDPLRFHSHFQAASYGWDDDIRVLDLVAGGRLGTGVKKGYLIGGAVATSDEDKDKDKDDDGADAVQTTSIGNSNPAALPRVRTFCIEWAAM